MTENSREFIVANTKLSSSTYLMECVLLAYICECPAPMASISIGIVSLSFNFIIELFSLRMSSCWTISSNVEVDERFLKKIILIISCIFPLNMMYEF